MAVRSTGDRSFGCPICDDPELGILALLGVHDMLVIAVTIPVMTAIFIKCWNPVAWGPVCIDVWARASVKVDLSEIGLSTRGIIDAVIAEKPGKLFGAIGSVRTRSRMRGGGRVGERVRVCGSLVLLRCQCNMPPVWRCCSSWLMCVCLRRLRLLVRQHGVAVRTGPVVSSSS